MNLRNFANHHLASILMLIAVLPMRLSAGTENVIDETQINNNLGKATRLSAGLNL